MTPYRLLLRIQTMLSKGKIRAGISTLVLMKWTQPSSHMSLTRGTMGGVARATHTHH